MSGGNQRPWRERCALGGAASLIGGLLATAALTPSAAAAEAPPAAAVEDCIPRPSERSIVVDQQRVPADLQDIVTATDQDGDVLQPIANVSEYEPELADEAASTGESLIPTLADPPAPSTLPGVAPAAPASEAEPTAEDVCIEEAVSVDDGGELAETAPAASPSALQPAGFNGITPGASTRAQVIEAWDEPSSGEPSGKSFVYQPEGFAAVEILFNNDVVSAIRIELADPVSADDLVARLGLADFRPLPIRNADGVDAAVAFPERGVTLSYLPALGDVVASDDATVMAKPSVGKIIIRPIQAGAFVARAEAAGANEVTQRMADLATALELDGASPSVRHELSVVKLAACQVVAAEQLAAEAVDMAPANDAFRLQWVKCLLALARYEEAAEQTRAILEGQTASPLVRADALHQMGLISGLGAPEVAARAVALHNKAIELADPLAASDDRTIQAQARQTLLGAHLAIAERLAAGDWQNKDEAVEQWISRASAIAEQMIVDRQADESARLRVAHSALVAGSQLTPPIDPALWIAEAEEAAKAVEAKTADAIAHDSLHWQLGLTYVLAAEIQHRRGESDLAISYGELADAAMTPLAESRRELPDAPYALGRVYFQIGAVHAVHNNDHDAACQWYDRAAELLLADMPRTPLVQPGQHGDALVSMGVSYWETGQQPRALELTKAGYELVDRGVSAGLLAETSLDVPRGNLEAMSRALGVAEPGPTTTDSAAQMARRPRAAGQPRVAGRGADAESGPVRRR